MNKKEIEEFATMKADVQYIKEALDENKEQHAELKTMITDFIESSDNRYATKLTERLVYGMAGLVLTAFVLFIINTVI